MRAAERGANWTMGLLQIFCEMRQSHFLSHIVRESPPEKRGRQGVFSACYLIEDGYFLKK